MLFNRYVLRGTKRERLLIIALASIVVGAIAIALETERQEREVAFQSYSSDLSASVEALSSKLTLLSSIGVLKSALKAQAGKQGEELLNRSIYNEENISALFLVDRNMKILAKNTVDAGGMYLGEVSEFSKINWEFAALRNVLTNKFGEFGVFNNRGARVLYVSKLISQKDARLGSLTAIFHYGDLMDALKIKHGIPAGVEIFLTEEAPRSGPQFVSLENAFSGYSVGFSMTTAVILGWAKWAILKALAISLILVGLVFLVFYLVNQKLVLPMGYFNALVDHLNRDPSDKDGVEQIPVPKEILPVLPKLQSLMQAIVRSSSVDLARQVAHDIRSPLAALNVVLSTVGKLDEETRLLVRHSITRIQDIANNLLEQSRVENEALREETKKKDVYLVSSLIEGIVTEKRTQYREHIGIEITHRQCEESYGIFCELIPSEFKRVLSNLVNNSVEAMNTDGAVTISTEIGKGFAKIEVKDTGKGLSREDIAKIGLRGFTVKAEGSGLGLSHAYKTIESWGGKLTFDSEIGTGTTVTIYLPLVESPAWFVDELKLSEEMTVGVLDDDSSVHQIWDRRLQSTGVQIAHFSTPEQLSEWLKINANLPTKFLIDYELIGCSESGLDLISRLGISENSVLVTSRFEEEGIRRKCAELRVPLIPKGLAGFIPIKMIGRIDAVLIDNEILVHEAWKYRAEQFGKKILCFKSSAEFLSALPAISLETPVYVDLNLESENGIEVSRAINQRGFSSIYLSTGTHASDLELDGFSFISGVMGKNPPWISEQIL